MALSRQPSTKFAKLKSRLADLLKYSELLQRFEQSDFGDQLGNVYRGLETDCEQLMQLRDWYKKVRSHYGIGFGKRVAIGSGLFNLDGEIIKGVHLIEKSQISSRLMTLVQHVELEAKLLPRISSLLGESTSWLGEQGILMQCYQQVRETLIALQRWFISPDMSLGQMAHFSELVQNMHVLQASLENDKSQLGGFLRSNSLTFGVNKDNQQTLRIINCTADFAEQLVDKINCVALATRVRHLASSNDYDLFRHDGAQIGLKWREQIQHASLYAQETMLDREQWLKSTNGSLSALAERNERAIQQPRWLNGWINFIRCYEQMHENGLQRIWSAVITGSLPIEKVELGLALAIHDQLAREVIHIHPELMRVSGSQRNALQNSFKEYDKKLIELQRQRIAAKVACRNIPEGNSGGKKSEYTELALIKNELGKKTRHIPIRQLINRACNALVAIKPCFMMGPMSAAHYLEPGRMEFDLVVMDEASQVKPEDALGVIARGKQLVVVGDPKQLPPTSFFDRSADGEDDDDAAALSDTDSILDAALPLFPMRRLRWHYRSRHEKLIAYSNRHFYNSDLVIFPSPNAESPEYGIKFTYVSKGRFSNQHNIEEAQAVAEAVLQHAQYRPGESLGVVAMSSKQRDQIERAIDELRRNRPEFNDAIDGLYAMEEPLFVKNLENVQGDERDVIFISFTYGPSEYGGKVYQRFGPINSNVGWRRLNVLFTRSKKRMHVFSSMRSEDVLTSETSKLGVISLKGFLQFAERGKLDSLTTHTGRAPDSDFEVAVMEALNHAGFECEPQVGVAGFFIDLAVKDPGCPGRYLMGIECDGAAYHSAKSARDRDRLRQDVLERLGWRISRIWSTDWFSNPDEVLSPIIRKLNEIKTLSPEVVIPSFEYVEKIESSAEVASESIDSLMPDSGLKEQLKYFAKHVIEVALPDVDEDHRLLRPAMLEALLEHQPLSRSEFVERIPHYLRQATDLQEAQRFLDPVLALIDGAEAETNDVEFESELI
ncbi:DNA helicase related protein [Edwardsiella anguillarum ET080813]|uniref:DNA helicase related protein n=2 Tax=Edwardsiella anguillarum TaxID=1821960 RepID=A0A076LPC4_9GAMM|nr:DNA helicase related protein [Edwardsiella anguillarum ET080813]